MTRNLCRWELVALGQMLERSEHSMSEAIARMAVKKSYGSTRARLQRLRKLMSGRCLEQDELYIVKIVT